jgi:hypothetical protein
MRHIYQLNGCLEVLGLDLPRLASTCFFRITAVDLPNIIVVYMKLRLLIKSKTCWVPSFISNIQACAAEPREHFNIIICIFQVSTAPPV